ncbi:hypothetical protein J6590_069379 [Homalodisca vitripennis]|nr:hypothetical protein J6590_069379 [Homalodisca vitripennis]
MVLHHRGILFMHWVYSSGNTPPGRPRSVRRERLRRVTAQHGVCNTRSCLCLSSGGHKRTATWFTDILKPSQ